jgi:hypothetical protein
MGFRLRQSVYSVRQTGARACAGANRLGKGLSGVRLLAAGCAHRLPGPSLPLPGSSLRPGARRNPRLWPWRGVVSLPQWVLLPRSAPALPRPGVHVFRHADLSLRQSEELSRHALPSSRQSEEVSRHALPSSRQSEEVSRHVLPSSRQSEEVSRHVLPLSQHALPSSQHTLPSSQHTLPRLRHALPSFRHALPASGLSRPSLGGRIPYPGQSHETAVAILRTSSSRSWTLGRADRGELHSPSCSDRRSRAGRAVQLLTLTHVQESNSWTNGFRAIALIPYQSTR